MAKSGESVELELIGLIYRVLDEPLAEEQVEGLAARYFANPVLPRLMRELLTGGVRREGEPSPAGAWSGPAGRRPSAALGAPGGNGDGAARRQHQGSAPVSRLAHSSDQDPTPHSAAEHPDAAPAMPVKLNTAALLTIWRTQSSLAPRDQQRWTRLMPHVMRALELRQVMAEETVREAATQAALTRIPLGIVLLSAEGRVVLANHLASPVFERLAGAAHAASAQRALGTPGEQGILRRKARSALEAVMRRGVGASQLVYLPGSEANVPVQLLICKLADRAFVGVPVATLACFVFNASRPVHLNPEILQRLYGYSATEIVVAQALVDGLTVKEIAEEQHVLEGTVRSHLKGIFRKTGVRRQTELMKVLLLGVAALATAEVPLEWPG